MVELADHARRPGSAAGSSDLGPEKDHPILERGAPRSASANAGAIGEATVCGVGAGAASSAATAMGVARPSSRTSGDRARTAGGADSANMRFSTDFLADGADAAAGAGNVFLKDKVYEWVIELAHGPNRDQALLELGKKREQYEDLAVVLWNSFGVMTVLVQEIISVYPYISPPNLSLAAGNRVCNTLALLQCVAGHDATRNAFLRAHLPLFLYPFLNTTSKARSFEYLRLTSLGVIGALVKNDSSEVVSFLLSTEIIPLCLRIIETGTELSKTVAIFILQKILMDDLGLSYVCHTYDRFSAVSNVLARVVQQMTASPPTSSRLLKHVVRCYLRLSDEPRARESLRQFLPEPLRDATFSMILRGDTATKRCLTQLLVNLSNPAE